MKKVNTIETEYVMFDKYEVANKKTYHIEVLNKRSGSLLAFIKWYGPFRQYTLQTIDGIVFDTKCLNEIIDYIKKLMLERKKQ